MSNWQKQDNLATPVSQINKLNTVTNPVSQINKLNTVTNLITKEQITELKKLIAQASLLVEEYETNEAIKTSEEDVGLKYDFFNAYHGDVIEVILRGNLPLLKYVGRTYPHKIDDNGRVYDKLIDSAIESNNLEILTYLHENFINTELSIRYHVICDNLEMLTYLHKEMGLFKSGDNIRDLICCGNKLTRLDCIKYLHEEVGIDITFIHVKLAIEDNSLDLAQYLIKNITH